MAENQIVPKPAIILRRLADMAERLGLSSNEVVLLYAGNNGWTNLEMSAAAINILEKIAGQASIELYEMEPYLVQLLKKGVIVESEAEIFGWRVRNDEIQPEPGNGSDNGTSGPRKSDRTSRRTVSDSSK